MLTSLTSASALYRSFFDESNLPTHVLNGTLLAQSYAGSYVDDWIELHHDGWDSIQLDPNIALASAAAADSWVLNVSTGIHVEPRRDAAIGVFPSALINATVSTSTERAMLNNLQAALDAFCYDVQVDVQFQTYVTNGYLNDEQRSGSIFSLFAGILPNASAVEMLQATFGTGIDPQYAVLHSSFQDYPVVFGRDYTSTQVWSSANCTFICPSNCVYTGNRSIANIPHYNKTLSTYCMH